MAFAWYAPAKSLYNAYQNAPQHTGSWGTKDFGLTEKVGSWLGSGSTNQGGSNILGSSGGGQIQGATSELMGPPGAPAGYQTPGPGGANPPGPSGGYTAPTQAPVSGTNNTPDAFTQLLNQQYDAQNNYINEMESGLGGQRSSMEQIANNTYQQGANSLGTAYDTSRGDLEGYQSKSLADIGDNLRAMWGQGSRVLGSRGAADSSAAGQYNYAISKLGSKQRGDVMQDVSKRLSNLKTTYDTNLQNLELEKNSQVQQIGQWYNEALNSIRGMRAELQQQKSEQALNMAMQMLNDARNQAAQRQSLLDSWAVNKAQSLPQLQSMLAQNAQGMQPVTSLGAGMNFGGATQNVNQFGFGNQEQDSLNWLQNLMPR